MRFLLPLLGTVVLGLAAASMILLALQQVSTTRSYDLPEEREISRNDVDAAANSVSLPERPDVFYAAITERPLFAQSRRPEAFAAPPAEEPAPVEAGQPEPEVLPPNIDLHGVSGSVDHLRALLSVEGGAPEWFETNAIIQRWVLAEIGTDWIMLQHAGRSFRVELYQK